MRLYYLFVVLILSACSDSGRDNVTLHNPKNTFAKDLIGDWGGKNEDSPVFRFKDDSVHYYQRHRSYPYTLQDSTLIFHFEGDSDLAPLAAFKIVKIDADSMLWLDYSLRNQYNDFFQIKAYRFKDYSKTSILPK